jgi:hypothetical protein
MRASDPSDHRKLTRRISTLAFAILGAFAMGGVFEGLIQANVQKFAERHGLDTFLIRWWDPIVGSWGN